MDKSLVCYYAVDSFGQGKIFSCKPVRDESLGMWKGEWNGNLTIVMLRLSQEGVRFPSITWRDEPVELKLSLSWMTGL